MKILIVEQEKTLQQSLCYFMQNQKNFEVALAHSQKEGLSLWQSAPFDMVLCADRLPDGNGLTMLKTLIQQRPAIVSILMTARHDELLREEAINLGIQGYLEKPFDLQQLEEAMGKKSP
ncbi:MAG: response regulator [Deltaproteobacteria bacterium]|nr:response regulator [Deltaproteobacteria bacterium]